MELFEIIEAYNTSQENREIIERIMDKYVTYVRVQRVMRRERRIQ